MTDTKTPVTSAENAIETSTAPERAGRVKTEAQLEQSFAGAESIAQLEPQYAKQILTGARQSSVDGANWAYSAGIIAILLGALLVFFLYPKKQREKELLAEYHKQDTAAGPAGRRTRAKIL